ncbi:hypothetical protein MRX96_012013 [Rhipicephalus microplus]
MSYAYIKPSTILFKQNALNSSSLQVAGRRLPPQQVITGFLRAAAARVVRRLLRCEMVLAGGRYGEWPRRNDVVSLSAGRTVAASPVSSERFLPLTSPASLACPHREP